MFKIAFFLFVALLLSQGISAQERAISCEKLITLIFEVDITSPSFPLLQKRKALESMSIAALQKKFNDERLFGQFAASWHNKMVDPSNGGLYTIPNISNHGDYTLYSFTKAELETKRAFFRKNSEGKIIITKGDGTPFSTSSATETTEIVLPEHGIDIKETKNTKRAIWVLSEKGELFIELHQKENIIHHNSLLNRPVAGAGEITIDDSGYITLISGSSGHFAPPRCITDQVVNFLKKQGIDVPPPHYDMAPASLNQPMAKPAHHSMLLNLDFYEKKLSIPRSFLNLDHSLLQ